MKKNFFKKLSFVLALAMIISALAPAAGAFAADAPHLSASSKTLLLGQADRDNYDFNIAHKQKGWKYEWTSSNDDVASVESNGLTTANKIGTADIKVVITKSGKDVATLVAPVTVKDNIKSIDAVTCSDAKQDLNKLAVDTDYTFERAFTTFGGSKTDTTAKTIWSVNEGATISATGVFKASTAGKYTITAMAFQSMDKYNTWKTTSDETLLLDSKSIDVVVVPGVVKTAQVDANTFAVTFDSDMSKTTLATDGLLYQVINGKLVTTGAEKIKAVSYDTAGKVATIDVLANLTSGATYNFVYGDLVGSFTAASRTLADVKRIDFKDFNADVNTTGAGTDLLQFVTAYDANDVAILTGTEIAALSASALTFAYASTGDLSKAFVSGSRLFNFTLGYPAPVVATFDNFVYNSTTLKYDEVKLTDSAVGTGVKADTSIDPATIRFVVDKAAGSPADDAAWGSSFTVAANDGLFNVHAEYKTKNANASTDAYTKTNDNSVFTYKSNDADKLLVAGATLIPLAAGKVQILVYSGTTVVTSFEVNIAPARTFQSLSQDVASVNVGNNAVVGETGNVKVTLIDSLGSKVTAGVVFGAESVTNAPAGVTAAAAEALIGVVATGADSNGAYNLAVDAHSVTAGAYTVKVPVTATINGTAATKDVYFTLIVGDSSSAGAASTVVRYQASVSDTTLNLKDVIAAHVDKDVTVDVYGYNAAGYRVVKVDAADYSFTVDKDGATFAAANYTSTAVADEMPVAVVAGAITTYATGTYLVKVNAVNNLLAGVTTGATLIASGNPVGYATLTISDTTSKTFSQKASSVSLAVDANVAGAVAKAFEFKVNDAVAATVTSITYTNGSANFVTDAGATVLAAGTTLYIDKVVVRVTVSAGITMDYTIDVKRTVAVNP